MHRVKRSLCGAACVLAAHALGHMLEQYRDQGLQTDKYNWHNGVSFAGAPALQPQQRLLQQLPAGSDQPGAWPHL